MTEMTKLEIEEAIENTKSQIREFDFQEQYDMFSDLEVAKLSKRMRELIIALKLAGEIEQKKSCVNE